MTEEVIKVLRFVLIFVILLKTAFGDKTQQIISQLDSQSVLSSINGAWKMQDIIQQQMAKVEGHHNITLCVDCTNLMEDFQMFLNKPEYVDSFGKNTGEQVCWIFGERRQKCVRFVIDICIKFADSLAANFKPNTMCIILGFCPVPPPPLTTKIDK